MKKIFLLIITLSLLLTIMVGCSKKADITKEEAYTIYYDTIKKFVPELMDKTKPPECDVDIKTRDEVTFVTEHFVRNTGGTQGTVPCVPPVF